MDSTSNAFTDGGDDRTEQNTLDTPTGAGEGAVTSGELLQCPSRAGPSYDGITRCRKETISCRCQFGAHHIS